MTKTKVLRPAVGTDGKISAKTMVQTLLAAGVAASKIKLIEQLTEAERAELGLFDYEALEAELDRINTGSAVWTQADLDRQSEIIAILGKAGRL